MASSSIKHRICLFIALALFAVSSIILAQAADLYNDWHFSGDTFKVGSDVFMVTHYGFYEEKVILDVNDKTFIIPEGECKSDATREYCIADIYRDIKNSTSSDHIKFQDGVPYAGINIKVTGRGPDLSIERTFSTTTPELGEEVSVSVVLTNEGDEVTDSLLYEESYPDNVVITTSSSSVERSSRRIKYSVNLPANSEKTFSYSFIINDYINFTDQAMLNYTYSGASLGILSSAQTIKLSKPYTLSFEVTPTSMEALEQSAMSFKIENTVSSTITVSELKLTIPSFFSVQIKPGELEKKGEKYYWNGSLEAGKSKITSLLLTPLKSGTAQVMLSLKAVDSQGKTFNETKAINLTSSIQNLESTLSVPATAVSEGASYRIAFSVKNPNKFVSFKNITASIKSDLFSEQIAELILLLPGQTQIIIVNDSFTAPFVDEKMVLGINASGEYKTSTSEFLSFAKQASVTVSPLSEVLVITQNFDKPSVIVGDEVVVTVLVMNNNAESIQVKASDVYDSSLTLTGGKSSGAVYFGSAATQQAYTYKLKVPADYAKDVLEITTTASIEGKEYMTTKSSSIPVTNPAVNVTVQADNQTQTQPADQQVVVPEKKDGFFKKVINGITDFFRRLLG